MVLHAQNRVVGPQDRQCLAVKIRQARGFFVHLFQLPHRHQAAEREQAKEQQESARQPPANLAVAIPEGDPFYQRDKVYKPTLSPGFLRTWRQPRQSVAPKTYRWNILGI